jgi:putative membrane protein
MSELNDPRVLFAAERTLLAWARTSLTLMAFGFAVERFSLVIHMLPDADRRAGNGTSFLIGVALILLGTMASILSVVQYQRFLKTLGPAEIPQGYWVSLGAALNVALGIAGGFLMAMLFLQHS